MEVKENLISFRVLWKGKTDRVSDTLRTKAIISNWLSDETILIKLELCGAPINGPIDLVLESSYPSGEENCKLLNMRLRELLTTFRENTDIERVWLKWNDITDDIIWTDIEAIAQMDRRLHDKGNYILIHKK